MYDAPLSFPCFSPFSQLLFACECETVLLILLISHAIDFLPLLTDCAGPWDSLPSVHSALQEVSLDPLLNPSLSSSPVSAPDSSQKLPLEATVCMADKAPPLADRRGATGGRSTEQKSTIRMQGTLQGSGEMDCGCGDRHGASKTVGRSSERRERQRETCSPCCEKKSLQTQTSSTAWPWNSYPSANSNGGSLSSGDKHLQERLSSRGLISREEERAGGHSVICCPSKMTEDPPAASAAASSELWSMPGCDKLPGTLRSWTSTVSR